MKIMHTFGPALLGLLTMTRLFAQAPAPMTPTPSTVAAPAPAAEAPGSASLNTPKPTTPPVRPVGDAAMVNGKPVTEAAVQRSLRTIPPTEHAKARGEIVNYLVDNSLIDQYLVSQKIPADPAEVEKLIAEFQKELKGAGTDVSKALANLMLTEEELKNLIEAQIRWDKFLETQATDEKLKGFFTSNTDIFDGTMVRARHILLAPDAKDPMAAASAQAQLKAIKEQIEKEVADAQAKLPADLGGLEKEQARCKKIDEIFANMAREKSVCPSKRDGGDVNWFPRAGSMVEAFARTAFALKPYNVSDVIGTPFGFHLIMTTARKDGQPTKFEDVKAEVKEVYGQKLKEAMCVQLRARAKIEILPAPPLSVAAPIVPMAPVVAPVPPVAPPVAPVAP